MLYIETLVVAKDTQSSGVGRQMVDFAKRFAKEKGFKILRTTSFSTNTESKIFTSGRVSGSWISRASIATISSIVWNSGCSYPQFNLFYFF